MHSDPVTQTECLHSLAGTLGHTPDNKQPGPCLQTRTGAASRGHGRQCLPALPCKAEALHGAQGAWLVSCKETEVGQGTGCEASMAQQAPPRDGLSMPGYSLPPFTHSEVLCPISVPSPCWYRALSQALWVPQELGHMDHSLPALQVRKGALLKPRPLQCLENGRSGAHARAAAFLSWAPILSLAPQRLTKAPDGHDVAPEGANHEVGPLLSHAQAAGQLGPGPCRRGQVRVCPTLRPPSQAATTHHAPGRTPPQC